LAALGQSVDAPHNAGDANVSDTILIVDNEPDMLTFLRHILKGNGYQVVESSSGQQALETLQQSLEPGGQSIDLTLLDIMMPDLSGIDVCHAIREQEAFVSLPVMMLTALPSVTDRLLAFQAGADDYLTKPVDHRELLARVQIQIRLRRAERDARRRIRELAALHTVSDALNRSVDLQSMLRDTLAVTCDVLRTHSGSIYLVDRDREVARLAVARGHSEEFELHPDIAQVTIGERNVGAVAASGESIILPDLGDLPPSILEILQREGIISAAFIPIRDEAQVVGVLVVSTKQRREFHTEETVLLETIGSQLGSAIARARLHQEAQAARDQARALARRIVQAQEDERARIARELHDQLGQAATALMLDLEMLRDSLGPDDKDLDVRLAEDVAIATGMLVEIKTLSLDLRPAILDDLGLEPALRWYIDRFTERTVVPVSLTVEGIGEKYQRLPQDIETVAFRCLQEALTNVARHAQAKHVEVTVSRRDDLFCLTATDDGVGFGMEPLVKRNVISIGLDGMKERVALVGGACQIHSQPGEGTKIIIEIPLSSPGG
jgi:signal transduction histidine kinase